MGRYELLTFGRWENPHDMAAVILRKVNRWIEIQDQPLERIYICPACGRFAHRPRGVWFRPTCPLHRREMMWYIPQMVEEDKKLFEKFKDLLAWRLLLLEVAAKLYAGRLPDEWRLYAPPAVEATYDEDPSVFRYAWWRGAVEAYLHRLDQEHHHKTIDYLRRVAVGLELSVEINPQFVAAAPPGAVYDREKNVYRIIEQP